jgi:hypothetical protein
MVTREACSSQRSISGSFWGCPQPQSRASRPVNRIFLIGKRYLIREDTEIPVQELGSHVSGGSLKRADVTGCLFFALPGGKSPEKTPKEQASREFIGTDLCHNI